MKENNDKLKSYLDYIYNVENIQLTILKGNFS